MTLLLQLGCCGFTKSAGPVMLHFTNLFFSLQVLKRMGLSLGLERGQVSGEDLAKAKAMLPRALEKYVTGNFGRYCDLSTVIRPSECSPNRITESTWSLFYWISGIYFGERVWAL